METTIQSLSPSVVWEHFAKICAIPHPSHHEAALRQSIQTWAQELGLKTEQDDVGNLLIQKPATPGFENRKKVALQAHLDMVPQANAETPHDFTQDPIQTDIDGDWVRAKGTTLGADNGMGMASCLAVLEATDIEHGPLEVVLTTNEEAGMTGAFNLQPGWLTADILINTDAEQEGLVYMGCAGGINAALQLSVTPETPPENYVAYTLNIKGLRGGHSGCDIHLGLANANRLLCDFFIAADTEKSWRIATLEGGNLRNAIPRECQVTLMIPESENNTFLSKVNAYQAQVDRTYAGIDDNILITSEPTEKPNACLSRANLDDFIGLLTECPQAVLEMSTEMPDVVKTSNNIGIISYDPAHNQITLNCLIRSLSESAKQTVITTMTALAIKYNATLETDGDYPGWEPNVESEIMQVFQNIYQAKYQKKPEIMVIHAGLECGLFKRAYPHLDMMSFGPTIKKPHSPNECIYIPSVALYWEQMQMLLAAIPEKQLDTSHVTKNGTAEIQPA